MSYQNIGLLYNKHYFRDLDFNNLNSTENSNTLKNKNTAILRTNLRRIKTPTKQYFQLSTLYPGLLFGSGYVHESTVEGEFKFGVSFDYTTGMPTYPGASLKGILKAAFEFDNGNYIKELLGELAIEFTGEIKALKRLIFENKYLDNESKEQQLTVYKRDVFLDCFPVGNGTFLKSDYITPHEHPLKNPVPIHFLGIKGGVTFQFNFILRDSTAYGGLTAENKLKLFKAILLDLGIGAKTNIGYGQFELNEAFENEERRIQQNIQDEIVERQRVEEIAALGISTIINDTLDFGQLKTAIIKYLDELNHTLTNNDLSYLKNIGLTIIKNKAHKHRDSIKSKILAFYKEKGIIEDNNDDFFNI